MALRNQPYFPLYVQDYLTDEKLNSCSASAQGVYIKILCILHKQDIYGTILLKQKDKQNLSIIENFALKLAKLLPFDEATILNALNELVDEKVLTIDGDTIYQRRMVKDGKISEERSKAAKKGGGNPNLYKQTPKQSSKQTDKQNTEYEIEFENEIVNENKKRKLNTVNYTEKFSKLWKVYNKGSKFSAFKQWKLLGLENDDEVLDKISTHVIGYMQRTEKTYRKDLERYLSSRLWEQ